MSVTKMKRDPRFKWEECGRAYVAHFGALSVSVRRRGSAAQGTLRWAVDYVFGNPFLGKGGPYESLGHAMAEAEQIAIREAAALARLLPPAKSKRRASPSGEGAKP